MQAFYSAADIPGKNSFTPATYFQPYGYLEDEEIFIPINGIVKHHSQPCGMIVADRMDIANVAARKVRIMYSRGNKNK